MNTIRRAITTNRHRLLKLAPLSTTQHHHASSYTTTKPRLKTTKTTKTPEPTTISSSSQNDTVWEKPSEIPWQAKVVNSVNLIGQVKIPVQFEASPDGKNWAGTIISQDEGSLQSAGSLQSFWYYFYYFTAVSFYDACLARSILERLALFFIKEKLT